MMLAFFPFYQGILKKEKEMWLKLFLNENRLSIYMFKDKTQIINKLKEYTM